MLKDGIDVLLILTNPCEFEAAYRRVSFITLYLTRNGINTVCLAPYNLTNHGLISPARPCIPGFVRVSTRVSTQVFNVSHFVNLLLAMIVLPLIILLIKPKVIVVSVPEMYTIVPVYIGSRLSRARFIIDVRDPAEEYAVKMASNGFSKALMRFARRVNYSVYRRADLIVAVTKALCTMVSNSVGRRCIMVPNGADLNIFKPLIKEHARSLLGFDNKSFLVTFIGHLTPGGYYDIIPIISIIKKLRKKMGVDIKLVIAGSLHSSIRNLIHRYESEGIIRYLGVLESERITVLLSASDIGIIPRVNDSFFDYAIPAKFYEYIACGLPVLAFARRSSELARTIRENSLGFVCEPNDMPCLEKTLEEIINNSNILEVIRKNVLSYRPKIDRKTGGLFYLKIIQRMIHSYA